MATEPRETQVAAIINTFTRDFEKALADPKAREDYLSIFSPEIIWTDHAFHIQRHGHEAVMGLQKAFTHCNQPFRCDVKALHHTADGVVMEAVWVGRCANDIVRPNGEVAVKAHGKDFVCHVCFVIRLDEEMKIKTIDEYYNKVWEDGVAEGSYQQIRGASMKT